jgi:hypothetical protein
MRFPFQQRPSAIGGALLLTTTVLALGACDRIADNAAKSPAPSSTASNQPNAATAEAAGELNWARAALQRNPNLELVATDAQSGVFTVRSKRTGETSVVKLSELVAGPASELAMAAPPPAPVAPEPPPPSAAPPAAEAPRVASSSSNGSVAGKGYTIERSESGQTRVTGPGVSIVSSGVAATTSANNAGQRTVDPMICEGHRMLHFDSRSIYVDGDAIIARGGCEIYITNSRIVAAGTGLIVRDAIVHISNSTIEGSTASFDASDGAQLYLRASTFQGLPRRSEKAVIQDQGGNQWR